MRLQNYSNPPGSIGALFRLSIIEAYIEIGSMDKAETLLDDFAASLNINTPNRSFFCKAAEIYFKLSDSSRAKTLLESAETAAEKISDAREKSLSLIAIAGVYIELGDKDRAKELLNQINGIIETIPFRQRAQCIASLVKAYIKLGDIDNARKLLHRAESLTLLEGTTEITSLDKCKVLTVIMGRYIELGDVEKVEELFDRIIGIVETIPSERDKISVFIQIANVFANLELKQKADNLQLSPEKQAQAVELWNKVVSKRNDFIVQAQAVYQPFLELVPEEYQSEVSRNIKLEIEKLYRLQEKEISARHSLALEENKELDLSLPLPFDFFSQRMNKVMETLPVYMNSIKDQLSQEEYETQKSVYMSCFNELFKLSANPDLDISSSPVSDKLFKAVSYGWNTSTQEELNSVPLIVGFIESLEEATAGSITIAETRNIISFLSRFVAKDSHNNTVILKNQLGKILNKKPEVRGQFLRKLHSAFADIDFSRLSGEARRFVVFLTQNVEDLKEKERYLLDGTDVVLPETDIEISQLIKLEQQRPKKDKNDIVMDMDYLLKHLNSLPQRSAKLESEILRNTTVQRESGAYTAEIAQNSIDATKGKYGELIVDFFLQKNAGRYEYAEEASDNGTGALKEVALLIPMSTKAQGHQIDLTGFFGTGKYTIFEGVDRLEIITNNEERAYAFIFNVIKDEAGRPIAIKLTGIRKIDDKNLKQGVTVRRVKYVDNTIPELDAMLAQESWKIFAGLAQSEHFKIYFIDNENVRRPLMVEKEILSEVDFKAVSHIENKEITFGKMRIISTKDMPLQIIDRAGLRVSELKEEYLALIPDALRRHIKELGIVIQIPLLLIRNRSAFEQENEYLTIIQKYVAIEFYKAIAYKTLTQNSPQFTFAEFPFDWETNGHYWLSMNRMGLGHIANLAKQINEENYNTVTVEELKDLLSNSRMQDVVRLVVSLMVPVDSARPDEKVSLYLRRLAIQAEADNGIVKEEPWLEDLGLTVKDVPGVRMIPFSLEKILSSQRNKSGNDQVAHIEDFVVEPRTPQERELVSLALNIAKKFDIKQVKLLKDEVSFSGTVKGNTMYLNRSIAKYLKKIDSEEGFIDDSTDTVVHEIAHFLEGLITGAVSVGGEKAYVAHFKDFTHTPVGTFADAMKYISAIWLLSRASAGKKENPPSVNLSAVEESAKPASSPIGKFSESSEALPIVENSLKSGEIVIFGDMHRGEQRLQDDEIWDRELFLDYVEQLGKLSMNFSVALEMPHQLEGKINDHSVSIEVLLDEYYKLIAAKYSVETADVNRKMRWHYLLRLLSTLKRFNIPIILIDDIDSLPRGGFGTDIESIEQSNKDMAQKLLEGRRKRLNGPVLLMVGRNHVVSQIHPIWLGGREMNSIPVVLKESGVSVKLIRPDDFQLDEENLIKFDLIIKLDRERQKGYLVRQDKPVNKTLVSSPIKQTVAFSIVEVGAVKGGVKDSGGIDLSKIELTLKDEKFVSNLNPADYKILLAAKALKQGMSPLSLLRMHEVMGYFKDKVIQPDSIQNRKLFIQVLSGLNSAQKLDFKALSFLKMLENSKPLEVAKLN